MAEINEDGGYGGTSPGGGICWISPSDLAGQVSNLMSRLAQAEADIERLKSANVTAEQLADISELLGLITGGAVILPDGSWAGQGGSIPVPADFTGSVLSGNVITTWNNGVVSFEVIPSTGVSVGGVQFAVKGGCTAAGVPDNVWTHLPFSGASQTQDTIGMTFGSDYFSVPVSGYYFISVIVPVAESFNPESMFVSLEVYDSSYPDGADDNIVYDASWVNDGSNNYSQSQLIAVSGIIHCLAGNSCYVDYKCNHFPGASTSAGISKFSIIKL